MEKAGVGQRVQACLSRSGGLTQLPFMLDYEGKVWDEPAGPEAVGYGPLDRIFQTADGWFYLVAESAAALRAIPCSPGCRRSRKHWRKLWKRWSPGAAQTPGWKR